MLVPSPAQMPTTAIATRAVFGSVSQLRPVDADRSERGVEHPVVAVVDHAPHQRDRGGHRDDGDEVQRPVGAAPLEPGGVQQGGDPDGQRDADEGDDRVDRGVAEGPDQLGVLEQTGVVLDAHPLGAAERAPTS